MSKRSYEKRVRAKREAERAARKRAGRMRKVRIWSSAAAALAIAAVLLIVFLGGDDTKPSAESTTSPSATPIQGCTQPAPAPTPNGKNYSAPPAMTIDQNKIYVATFETSCGSVKMRMDPKQSPRTVNNFVFLARDGFFDGTTIGRVQNEPSFGIVQAGTQSGNISGGVNYTYQGETPPPGTKYTRGIVAMANSQGPSTNGSQFFFVVTAAAALDANPNYSILGKVDEAASLAALDRILQAKGPPVDPQQNLGISPRPLIYILKVTIAEQNR